MKRYHFALILLCVALPIAMPTTAAAELSSDALTGIISSPSQIDLPMDMAIDIARAELPHIDTDESYATFIENKATGTRTWIVSFFKEGLPPPAGVVLVSSPSGKMLESTTQIYLDIEASLEQTRGKYYFWSLEDMAVFDAIYKKPTIYPRATLPTAEHISQDMALDIARQALDEAYGANLDGLQASCSFVESLASANSGELTELWIISFRSSKANEYQATISAATGEVDLLYANKEANS